MENEYVKSLGEVLKFEDFLDQVYQIPDGFNGQLPSDADERQMLVEKLGTSWFLPEAKHYRLYKMVHRVLRHGYIPRDNRKRIEIFGVTADWLKNHKKDNWVPIPIFKKPIITVSLFGSPGMGKSVFWDHVMSKCFQQVLPQGNTIQVTYLVLNCSAFSSLKALCINFFAELDNILTAFSYSLNLQYKYPYLTEFTKKVYSAEKLLPYMANVAAQHNLGVLIIDEINHLAEGNREVTDITHFFKNLTRAIGLPIIISGTQNGARKLGVDLQAIRRIVANGLFEWKFYGRGSGEWERFMSELWKFQVTNEKIELTKEIRDLFFEKTGGVMDLSVKLFIRVQTEAVEYEKRVDAKYIERIYKEFFQTTDKAVAAVKSKDPFFKSMFRDINEGFPGILEEVVKESDLSLLKHKLMNLNLDKDQAKVLVEFIKNRYPSISDSEAESKVKKAAKKVQKKTSDTGSKKEARAKKLPATGKLLELSTSNHDVKEQLDKAGLSGDLTELSL